MAKIKCEIDDDFQLYPNTLDGHPGPTALGTYALKSQAFGNSNEPLDCVVCGDRATGETDRRLDGRVAPLNRD